MNILTWAIGDHTNYIVKSAHLILTYVFYKYQVEPIGEGLEYKGLKQKLDVLYDRLQSLDDNEIVLCMDSFDTLFNREPDQLMEVFNSFETDLVMSAERLFMYQWPEYFDKFDSIESPYRYVNSGLYMGKAGIIKKMIEDIRTYPEYDTTEIDQGLIGIWIYNNIDSGVVKLDTNCELFWNVSGENDLLKEEAEKVGVIKNPTTGTHPFIIHVPGIQTPLGLEVRELAYKNIINRFEVDCSEPMHISWSV